MRAPEHPPRPRPQVGEASWSLSAEHPLLLPPSRDPVPTTGAGHGADTRGALRLLQETARFTGRLSQTQSHSLFGAL